jgi:hypothetical protein
MTIGRRGALVAAVPAILLGAGAARAAETSVSMSLRGSNGFALRLGTFRGGLVELEASRGVPGGTAYARYLVHGEVSAEGIDAELGALGRIDARFDPAGAAHAFPASGGCPGGRAVHRAGRFVGTIRFRGEEAFTSVAARSAKGSVLRTCAPAEEPRRARTGSNQPPVVFQTQLAAARKAGGRLVSFNDETTARLGPDGRLGPPSPLVQAELEERRGPISIERSAVVEDGPIAASPLGAVPVTASVAMRGPFSGAGAYRAEAGSAPSWSGDLRVALPGAGEVPLAGPGFTAILCRGRSEDEDLEHCQNRAGRLLAGGT